MPVRLELTMMSNIYLFVFCFAAYFPIANTDTVWLKDVTTRHQRVKRSLHGLDLPEKLSFLLKRNSDTLTLNLKRNYHVDPNADIYTVRNLNDGRSILEKTVGVEKEDMAYYQDRENGAFMAARCVERSNGQCDILINGNIKIGERNYDLQPSKDDSASRNILENTDLLGKRYLLQDQSNIESDIPYIQELSNIEIDMPVQQDKLDIGRDQDFQQDEANNDGDMVVERKDKVKTECIVKVVALLDSSVFNLYFSLVNTSLDFTTRVTKAEKNMRRYFSYIINGVDQLYTGINDANIEIHVKIRVFVVFKSRKQFPHHFSRVEMANGTAMINASTYITDLVNLDLSGALRHIPDYDQVMLFTRLGAVHDGADTARDCRAEDGFIMTPLLQEFDPKKAYSENPWIFSKCSVDAFKRTLVNKPSLTNKLVYTQPELDEWNKFMAKLPGQKYSPSMQCQLILGLGSAYCGALPGSICRFMHCIHPTTKKCLEYNYSAAPGTICGINMWCQKGECVKIHQT